MDKQSHIGNSQVSDLTTEQNRTHHRLCRVCRTIISSHPTETICPRCRFDAASFKKTDIEQYESKGIVAESNPEDDLLAAVMSIFSVRPICCTYEIAFINTASRTQTKTWTTQTMRSWRGLNYRILRLEFSSPLSDYDNNDDM